MSTKKAGACLWRLLTDPNDMDALEGLSENLQRAMATQLRVDFESADAADLAIERTVKLYERIRTKTLTLASERAAGGFVRRVVFNAVASLKRQEKRRPILLGEDATESIGSVPDGGSTDDADGAMERADLSRILDLACHTARDARVPRYREEFERQWKYAGMLAQGVSTEKLLEAEGIGRGDPVAFGKGRNRLYNAQKKLRREVLEAIGALEESGRLEAEEAAGACRFVQLLARCQRKS